MGVVGDIRQDGTSDAVDLPQIYVPYLQNPSAIMSLLVRTSRNPLDGVTAVRSQVWSVDKDQPIIRVATMDNLLSQSAAERRFVLILFEAFGLVALALAATGIYAVLSSSVTERTKEIGVRSALGASSRGILTLVMRQGMQLTAIGILLGLAGSVAATQAIGAMLFGISPLDPFTYLGVILLLAAVSVIACGVPAWRAARIDPMVALRYE